MSSTASPLSRAPGVGAAISVRRFANDEIARVGSSLDDLDDRHQFEFLCECGDLSCNQFVRMTVVEYHSSAPGSVVGHPVPGQSQIERARRLREEAEALTRQAEHQTRRARRAIGREGVSDERR